MGDYTIGLVGLAVMGQNLVLNMERNGFPVAVFNRTVERTHEFLAGDAKGKRIKGCATLEELVASLSKPRKIMLMVQAGRAVDAVIEQLVPLIDKGDLIIDGGNSFYKDTERRAVELAAQDINYIGTGVSGGEYGALHGPAIMPGGQEDAYAMVAPIFEAIAARAEGEPCVAYLGPRGAGHYVKMVHNGIEYGDMQLIAEAYDIMHRALELSATELGEIFGAWNQAELESYLIEITRDIFYVTDAETGRPLVDMVLDEAQQKGTGKWTSQDAMDVGMPLQTINSAVESRIISALKSQRVAASQILTGPTARFTGDKASLIEDMRQALFAAKICSYAQGMGLLRAASDEYKYDLKLGVVAKLWRGGCIIRARFLNDISAAYDRNPGLQNLLLDSYFRDAILSRQDAL
ncbi:MAG: NADP-dependent phosphogluconate dehydrogenase, partial [Anaerolineae bacterium]